MYLIVVFVIQTFLILFREGWGGIVIKALARQAEDPGSVTKTGTIYETKFGFSHAEL